MGIEWNLQMWQFLKTFVHSESLNLNEWVTGSIKLVLHYKQNSRAVRNMSDRPLGPMSGNLSSEKSQDTYNTCRTKGIFFGEQRSTTMNGRQSLFFWICVGYVWWWLGELFDSCPVANISPPLLHSVVGKHDPPTAIICRNHWLKVQHNSTVFHFFAMM